MILKQWIEDEPFKQMWANVRFCSIYFWSGCVSRRTNKGSGKVSYLVWAACRKNNSIWTMRSCAYKNYLQPSLSLIKLICYPEQRQFTSAACQYGCSHEDSARQIYIQKFVAEHEEFLVFQCGLILDPKFPFLGASPDGLANYKCCNSGVLEIKCPF